MKKMIFHIVISLGVMVTASLTASVAVLPFDQLGTSRTGSYIAQGILYAGVALFLVRVIVLRSSRQKNPLSFEELGICKPQSAVLWILIGILLPTLVSCFYLFLTEGVFSQCPSYGILTQRQYIAQQTAFAVFIAGLGPGVVEEVIFRGMIMSAVRRISDLRTAVILPSFFFGIIHLFGLSSLDLWDILLLLAGGTTVGIMFSLIRIQSHSVFASAIVHGIWNAVVVGGIIEIGQLPQSTAIYQYQLTQRSLILTGGAFGIEAGLPAIIGYLAVSALSFALIKKDQTDKGWS